MATSAVFLLDAIFHNLVRQAKFTFDLPAAVLRRHARGAVINTFVRVLNAVAGAALLGFAAGFALLLIAPCRWFGSSFEGACGYGAMFAAIGLGLLVAIVSFGVLLWRESRRAGGAAEPGARPSSQLFNAWIVLLVMQYALPLLLWVLPAGGSDSLDPLGPVVIWALLALFIGVSWVLFRRCGMAPALALLVFIPLVGPLVVGALLWKPARAAVGKTA